jgi:hypothetical protein
MGRNQRNDEIRDNIVRMQREWEAQRDALATVRRVNARLSAKGSAWFWPKIAAAINPAERFNACVASTGSAGTPIAGTQ